ncbi:MAG: hypothetical protein HY888_09175 [Deltaproteobacteria bacterium]|nr:hypothetical protein [Deltaproteobacteria bacterium]
MFRRIIMVAAVFMLLNSVGWGAEAKKEFTQKDFAQLVVEQFSWDSGLPKEPADRDYLLILGGKRTFSYEAESSYNDRTDLVSTRDTIMFGPFTGKGWILGVSSTTSANFTVLLPVQGEYILKAVIKGDGFVWNVDKKDYRADSKSAKFREVEVGKIFLKAGIVKIEVTIPPEGAIDSFSFAAADYTPIQPLVGWRFKERLTAGRMAEIAVSMMSGYSRLPESPDSALKTLSAAEAAILPESAAKTGTAFLGKFFSTEWIRADYRGASIQIPVKVDETGYYSITANLLGDRISGSVNESRFEFSGKQYLDKLTFGPFRFESGDNMITVNLPPMGGIDTVEFSRKSTLPADFLKLAGISGPPERPVTADEARSFLKSFQSAFPVRK